MNISQTELVKQDQFSLKLLNIYKSLLFIFFLIIVSGIIGFLSIYEMNKAARFHEVNFQHMKYNFELLTLSKYFQNEPEQINQIKNIVEKFQIQPRRCLKMIGPLERLFFAIVESSAIELICQQDLNYAEKFNHEINLFSQGSLSEKEFLASLVKAKRNFKKNSEKFELLVTKTVQFISWILICIAIINAIIAIAFFVFFSLGIRRTLAYIEKIHSKLSRKAKELEVILMNLHDGVIVTDNHMKWDIVNKEAQKILGITNNNLTESEFHSYPFFHLDGTTPYDEQELPLQRAVRQQESLKQQKIYCRTRQGAIIISVNASPIFVDGEQTGGLISFRDVTYEEKSKIAIQMANERFDYAVKGSSTGIWDWLDIRTDHVYWSENFYQLLGYDNSELKPSLTVFENELLHPDDLEKTQKLGAEHIAGKRPLFATEYRLRNKNGEYRWYRATGVLTPEIEGRPQRMVGSIQDIHVEKLNSQSLQQAIASLKEVKHHLDSERIKLQAIFELAGDPIITADSLGHILTFNRAAEQLFKYNKDEIIGQNVKILTPPNIYKEHDHYLASAVEQNKSGIVRRGRELQAVDKDGHYFDIHLSISIIDHEDEKYFIAIIKDMSKITSMTRDLQRSNKELEQFAYLASHDLQEPLRTITSYTTFILDDIKDKLNKEQIDDFYFVTNATNRMKSLISDLLSYSRVGRKDSEYELCDLNVVLAEVQALLSGRLKETNAELSIQSLPSITARKQEMILLFQNLIGNALKFSRPDSKPHITIEANEYQDTTEIIIDDNGIGISQEYHEKIFKVFQRLHSRQEYEGTGIGLAICQKIIDSMRGEISLVEKNTPGARFKVVIPKWQKITRHSQ